MKNDSEESKSQQIQNIKGVLVTVDSTNIIGSTST